MEKKGMSQETLKLIACVTMLIDHIAASLVWQVMRNTPGGGSAELWCVYRTMRVIGRIAFPIYCFLLVEGFYHTRDLKKYIARLGIGILLAEIPYDLVFFGGWTWESQSVMVTLLLGCLMMVAMERVKGFWKFVMIAPFYIAAELLKTDYAGLGIAIIAVFALTRGMKYEKLLRVIGLGLLLIPGVRTLQIGGLWFRMQSFAILALIPIFCYDGRKLTQSKLAQWAFYLFYPVHMAVLLLISLL